MTADQTTIKAEAMAKAIEAWESQTSHEFSSDGLEAACLAFHEHMLAAGRPTINQTTGRAISGEPPSEAAIDSIAREIAANIAAQIEQFYPSALTERGLINVRAWARNEVNRWFAKPDAVAANTTLDQRLRASAAHRRHIRRLRNLSGKVSPGDALEPLMQAMEDSAEQARLDYRAGGPVIEGDAE